MVGSSWEIWCSNRETGRFHEKLGDSRENQESWQVCVYFQEESLLPILRLKKPLQICPYHILSSSKLSSWK